MLINIEKIDGTTYYSTEYRGVIYTLYYSEPAGAWSVTSRRKALGRWNMGTHRYFKNLSGLEKAVKGFRGISALIEAEATAHA